MLNFSRKEGGDTHEVLRVVCRAQIHVHDVIFLQGAEGATPTKCRKSADALRHGAINVLGASDGRQGNLALFVFVETGSRECSFASHPRPGLDSVIVTST